MGGSTMLTIYDLNKQQMLNQPDFFSLLNGYDYFEGVSFVSGFKIIDQELLSRFRQVNLILGLEDQQTSQAMNQFFNISQRAKALASTSDNFISRLADQTLHLKFTKGPLFHSKYFILRSGDHFRLFNGSMNLTKRATSSNHELMWMYTGTTDDSLYQAHHQLFLKNFNEDSAEYLDRKIIDQLKNKSRQEIGELLTTDVLNAVESNEVKFSPEDVRKVVAKRAVTDDSYELLPRAATEIVKAIYTPKGNKRRTPQQTQEKVKKIVYQSFKDDKQTADVPANSLYPKPMWSYSDKGELIVQDPTTNHFYPLQADISTVSREDVVNFIQIIKSFRYNKVRDESQQALSAFMYLMTAPLIWKIRQIYRDSNFAKSPDQVPVSMVLIGRGTTGKTLLVRDYFKRFIGDHSDSIEYLQINQGISSHTNRAVDFLGYYLQSGRFVSPMIIDELNDNFLHSKVSTNAIKQWSNTIKGIHNVNIFAMNHNAGSRSINNLEEITKRVYYLSFEAGWLEMDQQKYNFEILVNNTNDHIYRYVTHELNDRLNNLSGIDESNLVDDYLSQTKAIVKNLLAHFNLEGELADIIDENYNYKVDRNRITWKMLIRDDGFQHVAFTSGDDQQFTVSKAIFNNLKGSAYENINQTLDNYFNMFPRELGIAIYQYDNGMILNIDKFDHYIGEPLIRNYYNKVHKSERQDDQLAEMLKLQKKRDEQNAQVIQDQTKIMNQMMKQMKDQQDTKKKGLFSRFFRK